MSKPEEAMPPLGEVAKEAEPAPVPAAVDAPAAEPVPPPVAGPTLDATTGLPPLEPPEEKLEDAVMETQAVDPNVAAVPPLPTAPAINVHSLHHHAYNATCVIPDVQVIPGNKDMNTNKTEIKPHPSLLYKEIDIFRPDQEYLDRNMMLQRSYAEVANPATIEAAETLAGVNTMGMIDSVKKVGINSVQYPSVYVFNPEKYKPKTDGTREEATNAFKPLFNLIKSTCMSNCAEKIIMNGCEKYGPKGGYFKYRMCCFRAKPVRKSKEKKEVKRRRKSCRAVDEGSRCKCVFRIYENEHCFFMVVDKFIRHTGHEMRPSENEKDYGVTAFDTEAPIPKKPKIDVDHDLIEKKARGDKMRIALDGIIREGDLLDDAFCELVNKGLEDIQVKCATYKSAKEVAKEISENLSEHILTPGDGVAEVAKEVAETTDGAKVAVADVQMEVVDVPAEPSAEVAAPEEQVQVTV